MRRAWRLPRSQPEVDEIKQRTWSKKLTKSWETSTTPPPDLARLQSEELQVLSAKVDVLRQQVLAGLPPFLVSSHTML